MPQVRDGYSILHATFSVENDGGRLALTIESRSGARHARNARNPDYDPALELLLTRLAAVGARIADAQVYSTTALRDYPDPAQRRLQIAGGFPIAITLREPLELRRALARAQRVAARPPELTSSGNNNKRVRFWLEVPGRSGADAKLLETQLAGEGPPAQVTSSDPDVHPTESIPSGPPGIVQGAYGQGYVSDPAIRRAVELRAMRLAIEWFENEGWHVEDTSATQPYDLCCTRNGEDLYVEVKGMTGRGKTVHLTAGEVDHMRAHPSRVALFVVIETTVSGKGTDEVVATGGRPRLISPLDLDAGELRPVAYDWTLPAL